MAPISSLYGESYDEDPESRELRIVYLKQLECFSIKSALSILTIETVEELSELRKIALEVTPGLVPLIDQVNEWKKCQIVH